MQRIGLIRTPLPGFKNLKYDRKKSSNQEES